MLDDTQLHTVMPTLAEAKRALYLPHLNAAMRASGVGGSMLRTAAFIAQLAHQSGPPRWLAGVPRGARPGPPAGGARPRPPRHPRHPRHSQEVTKPSSAASGR